MLTVYLSEKATHDWRAGVVVPGGKEDDSDYEYRAQGSTKASALRDLASYIEREGWDCELPKETAVLSIDNYKVLKLAGDLLNDAASEYSNHSCNDWKFPKDWTEAEQILFVKDMYEKDHRNDFDENNLNVPDWWVMKYLAKKLQNA